MYAKSLSVHEVRSNSVTYSIEEYMFCVTEGGLASKIFLCLLASRHDYIDEQNQIIW